MRRSVPACIVASKYSASPGAARKCVTALPTLLPARVASIFASYQPGALVGTVAWYWPGCSPSHDIGTSEMVPSGAVTVAITAASFSSTNDGSTMFAVSVAPSPGSTRSVVSAGST